jgi:hypothetical protein
VVAVTLLLGGQYLMNTGSNPTANFNNSSIQTTDQKDAGGAVPAAMTAAPAILGPQTATQVCPTKLGLITAASAQPSPLPSLELNSASIETVQATSTCP